MRKRGCVWLFLEGEERKHLVWSLKLTNLFNLPLREKPLPLLFVFISCFVTMAAVTLLLGHALLPDEREEYIGVFLLVPFYLLLR